MSVERLDNVLIVVEELEPMIDFFTALGLRLESDEELNGTWVETVIGLKGVSQRVAVLRTPDGRNGVELARFEAPEPITPSPAQQPANTLGMRRAMFAVDDLDATVERLSGAGGSLVGGVAEFEAQYRLCYVRGPEHVVVGLAQAL